MGEEKAEKIFVQDTENSNKTNIWGLFSYSDVRSAFCRNEGFSRLTEEGLKYRLVFRMGSGKGPFLDLYLTTDDAYPTWNSRTVKSILIKRNIEKYILFNKQGAMNFLKRSEFQYNVFNMGNRSGNRVTLEKAYGHPKKQLFPSDSTYC